MTLQFEKCFDVLSCGGDNHMMETVKRESQEDICHMLAII